MTFQHITPNSTYKLATSNRALGRTESSKGISAFTFPLFSSSAHNVFLAIATFSILGSGLSTTTTLQMSYLEHMCASFCHLLGKSLLLHFPTASTSATASK